MNRRLGVAGLTTLLLVAVPALAEADALQTTFESCMSNAGTEFTQAGNAQGNPAAYYADLCAGYAVQAGCYAQYAPDDPGAQAVFASRDSYCALAAGTSL